MHNAEKFDRKPEKTVVQIPDFKETLWLQLTWASMDFMPIVMPR